MTIDTDAQKIEEILARGVGEVIDNDRLRKKLMSGEKLRIKFGVDPTSPNLHIGRAVSLLKLKDLQDLGHEIVLIVGDFTGVIGDTSDKDSERPMLSSGDIKKNMKTYFSQAGKILNMRKVEKHYNSKWLKRLGYAEIGEQADQFSVSDFISRDNIKKRLDSGKRISLREVLYPLMQGYDSVQVKADVEIGGTDQRFNLLAGRKLQQHFGQETQDILMTELLLGLDGRKMSSSWGNTIDILDKAEEMYGKVMSMDDKEMVSYFLLCTRVPVPEVEGIKVSLSNGDVNPRDIKMRLAREIATIYHGEKEALKAEEVFVKTFQKKEVPEEIEKVSVDGGEKLIDVMVSEKIVKSKTEARRLIADGAVKNVENDEKITDTDYTIEKDITLKIGKKRFVKVNIK